VPHVAVEAAERGELVDHGGHLDDGGPYLELSSAACSSTTAASSTRATHDEALRHTLAVVATDQGTRYGLCMKVARWVSGSHQ
jgi:hypothetical protein